MFDPLKQLITRFVARRRAEARAQALRRKRNRASAAPRRERQRQTTLRRASALMSSNFVVADLETTGFSSADQILEISAVRVTPNSTVCDVLSTLVTIRGRIPPKVVELTGITDALMQAHGVSLHRAFKDFIDFCEDAPVFFHNAGFDTRFLRAAADQLGVSFNLPVYCSLKTARAAWPGLRSYRLEALARLVDAPAPTHRGLDDVYTTLAVLTTIKDYCPVAAAA